MKSLYTDKDGKLSLGRTLLLILFLLAIGKFWLFGVEVPGTMATAFMTLLGYEVAKKGRDAYIQTKKSVGADPS